MTFEEYMDTLEADYRRAQTRRGVEPPLEWGSPMEEESYFCTPCWRSGEPVGRHPYSDPPCDPISRESRWA